MGLGDLGVNYALATPGSVSRQLLNFYELQSVGLENGASVGKGTGQIC